MLSARTLVVLVAIVLAGNWWRTNRAQPPVVLGAAEHHTEIRQALQQIDGAVRGRIDTVDLSRPHMLRVSVKALTSGRAKESDALNKGRIDNVVMEAHARLAWGHLAPFRTYSAFDTVLVTLHSEYRSAFGLLGIRRVTRGERFVGPFQRGWSRVWPGELATSR